MQSDSDSADFTLQGGHVWLEATDGALIARVKAEDAKLLIDARYVIDKHLVIFAFRERFARLECRVIEPS